MTIRLAVTYLLVQILGVALALGVAWLVSLVWPLARIPVFLVIAVWWLWIGWRYAQTRDRGGI